MHSRALALTPRTSPLSQLLPRHVPGKTLRFIEQVAGVVHFFGPGTTTKVTPGKPLWRLDVAASEVRTHEPRWGERGPHVFGAPGDAFNPVSHGEGLLKTKMKITLATAVAWCGGAKECAAFCHNDQAETWYYSEEGQWALPVRPTAVRPMGDGEGTGWKCFKRNEGTGRGEFTLGDSPFTTAEKVARIELASARKRCAANGHCTGICHNSGDSTWMYKAASGWPMPPTPVYFQGYAHSKDSKELKEPATHTDPDLVGCYCCAKKLSSIFAGARFETLTGRVPSAKTCAAMCDTRGYSMAAVALGGDECTCADGLAAGVTSLSSDRCSLTCDIGGTDLPCGGPGATDNHVSVYQVAKLWK